MHAGGNLNELSPTFDDRVARGDPAVRRSRSLNWNTGIEFDRRKWYTPVIFAGHSSRDQRRSHSYWISSSLQFRVASRFSASADVYYEKSVNDDEWFDNVTPTSGSMTSYTFARLDQSTFGMTGRVNYTATPTLLMQLHAQPFISSGDYSDWRELDNPRAAKYTNRFKPYSSADPGGFNVREFRLNTVVRWELRPETMPSRASAIGMAR